MHKERNSMSRYEDNFFSINKLVEFGMSLSIAQQMVKVMNESSTCMRVPGAMNGMQPVSAQFHYAVIQGQPMGPFSEQELCRLILEKKILRETYIWKPGMLTWEMAEKLPEILKLVALTPPSPPTGIRG